MNGYNWTDASTPQGRERLKELLKGMKSPDFVAGALSYKPGERHLVSIWPGKAEHALYSLDKFLNDAIPIKEFLDPSPRLEPPELQWKPIHEYMDIATHNGWEFSVNREGWWWVRKDGNLLGYNEAALRGDEDYHGDMETAKSAIHEWRVNLLKSMTGGK